MRIGINGSGLVATGASLAQLVEHAVAAERDGFASYWLGQMAVPDRPAPRVVAGLPVCVTDRPDRVRAAIDQALHRYAELPSYRSVLDAEGARGPGDVALVGDAATVRAALADLAEAGATDFAATEFATTPTELTATRTLLTDRAAP